MAPEIHRAAARGLLCLVVGWAGLMGLAWGKPPNIVFILADDLDSAAAATMSQVKTLITDQGMDFPQHYVNISLCCPSRVSMLRGQFGHNTGIMHNSAPAGGFQGTYSKGLENSTLATWLQAAGYRTALLGKYLNGYPDGAPSSTYIPPGWSEWYVPIGGDPYGEYDYTLNENGSPVPYGHDEADYLTDVLASKASDFIRRSVTQYPDRPFFAFVSTYAPHFPATPAPRHADAFPDIRAPRPPSFNEPDVSDKPSWLRTAPLLTEAEIAEIDTRYRKRRQSLLAVDELVKGLVDTLQATGQLNDTYVVFTSDNGLHQGQHRLMAGKSTAFEEDIVVPLSIRGPGVPAGQRAEALTVNVDFAPTLADIAGATAPDWVDGRSLMPFLRGQVPAQWRRAVLIAHDEVTGPLIDMPGIYEPPDPFDLSPMIWKSDYAGLRTADGHTYVEYKNGEFELYNNAVDPWQLRNRYSTAPAKLTARMASWLAALRNASGEALRQAELRAP